MSKWLLSFAALVVASLQAWDSQALEAEGWVQMVVLVAVVAPALAIFSTRDVRVRGAAVLLAAVLMVAARVVSAQHMPALALAAFFPAILVLLDHIRSLAAEKKTPLVAPGPRE